MLPHLTVQRWFVFYRGRLDYYTTQAKSSKKGDLSLALASVARAPDDGKRTSVFVIETPGRMLYLHTVTQEELGPWLDTIQFCILRTMESSVDPSSLIEVHLDSVLTGLPPEELDRLGLASEDSVKRSNRPLPELPPKKEKEKAKASLGDRVLRREAEAKYWSDEAGVQHRSFRHLLRKTAT